MGCYITPRVSAGVKFTAPTALTFPYRMKPLFEDLAAIVLRQGSTKLQQQDQAGLKKTMTQITKF